MKRKKKGSSSIGYVFLFTIATVILVIGLFLLTKGKLMTEQHYIDDALTDSVLASLVIDDDSLVSLGSDIDYPNVRLKSTDNSFSLFKECLRTDLNNCDDFYHNLRFDSFITYEVSDNSVTITSYSGNTGLKSVSTGKLGEVKSPTGKIVERTSAYGKVRFDILNSWNGQYYEKTRDCYCDIQLRIK